jgi:hypothetical protein
MQMYNVCTDVDWYAILLLSIQREHRTHYDTTTGICGHSYLITH